MKTYIGTKIIKAKPMDYHTFIKEIKGEEVEENRENANGYLVEYLDGYQSWNVDYEFEKVSRKLTDAELKKLSLDYLESNFEWFFQTKIVNAEPMLKADFEEQDADDRVTPEEGYKIIYPNGYKSWSPKGTFENTYREISLSEVHLIV